MVDTEQLLGFGRVVDSGSIDRDRHILSAIVRLADWYTRHVGRHREELVVRWRVLERSVLIAEAADRVDDFNFIVRYYRALRSSLVD